MQVVGILLLVILSFVDFIRVITGSDDDGLRTAFKNTGKRIILVILLLIIPWLITWILNLINMNRYQVDENNNYLIGEDGNPLCKVTQK